MNRSILSVLALALAGATMVGCGALEDQPLAAGADETRMRGWEQRFSLEWSVAAAPDRSERIEGYVTSHHGSRAEAVRVLAQALDGSGVVVGRRIAWVPGGVGGFGRAHFEVRDLPAADHYRVTVWDYDLLES
jgi:hypothetical protein